MKDLSFRGETVDSLGVFFAKSDIATYLRAFVFMKLADEQVKIRRFNAESFHGDWQTDRAEESAQAADGLGGRRGINKLVHVKDPAAELLHFGRLDA